MKSINRNWMWEKILSGMVEIVTESKKDGSISEIKEVHKNAKGIITRDMLKNVVYVPGLRWFVVTVGDKEYYMMIHTETELLP